MTKLYYSNVDIRDTYLQVKAAVVLGSLTWAKDRRQVLKDAWNSLNAGMVDVEDVDLLYNKLRHATKLIGGAYAARYDRLRNSN